MPAHRGFRSATDLRPGDSVWAEGPSPLADIIDGQKYVVAEISREDSMGYVRVEGDPCFYRPYLFRGTARK